MATIQVNGVNLFYEVTGTGDPLVLLHESCSSFRGWDPQVKFFSRHYQVITYNARGYPPSDVPTDGTAYSQEIVVEDLYQLLRALGISEAYVAGLSMGGMTALRFAMAHPEMARGLILASAGGGATNRQQFEEGIGRLVSEFESGEFGNEADTFMHGPSRFRLQNKSPKAWQETWSDFLNHSPEGLAHTFRSIVVARTPATQLVAEMEQLAMPTLIIVGDEDSSCIEPGLLIRKHIPNSGLAMFPQSGHVVNVEEPELFNRIVLDFLTSVEKGHW